MPRCRKGAIGTLTATLGSIAKTKTTSTLEQVSKEMRGSRLGERRASARNCSRLGSAVRKASCRVLIGQSAITKSALQGSRLQLQSRLRNQKIVNCA